MIPGKVFFQSIIISQQLSSKYYVCLLLNGIYYDKIKLFQTKYMCLTPNDQLEVQINCKYTQQQNKILYQKRQDDQKQNICQKQMQQKVMRILIPQSYRLMIQNKTIQIKYNLSSQQIKLNILFQTVASFSRKKLATNSPTPNKNLVKREDSPNIFQKVQQIQNYSYSPQNITRSKISRSNISPSYFNKTSTSPISKQNPTKFNKTLNNFFQQSPQQNQKLIENEKLNYEPNRTKKTLELLSSGIGQQQQGFSDTYSHKMKNSRKTYDYMFYQNTMQSHPNQDHIIIQQKQEQKQQSQNIHHLNQQQKQHQYNYQNFNYNQKYNFVDSYNQHKIRKFNQYDHQQYGQQQNQGYNESQYQSQVPSEVDTLQSLAYQRQKILGQLFSKYNNQSK